MSPFIVGFLFWTVYSIISIFIYFLTDPYHTVDDIVDENNNI